MNRTNGSNTSARSAKAHSDDSSEPSGSGSALDPAAERLLVRLAEAGASACEAEFGKPGAIDVVAMRKGISLRVAGSTMALAETLVRHDLASWNVRSPSGRRYLEISEVGLAHCQRTAAGDDGSDGFQAQHRALMQEKATVDGMQAQVTVDSSESPLAWLASRTGADGKALIDTVQLAAGERLRRDLEIAQMMPRVTANWQGGSIGAKGGDSGQHISDMMIAARQRVDAAVEAVGSDCAGILIDVCGFLKGLATIEFERSWPRRSAKVVLGIALSALARHYGLEHQAVGRSAVGRLRHWGAPDFRPSIDTSTGEPPTLR